MHINKTNTLDLTLVPPQSGLTSTRLAEVRPQAPSPPEFPFSVSKPVIYRILLLSCTLNRETTEKHSTKEQNFESSAFLILTQVMQKLTLQGSLHQNGPSQLCEFNQFLLAS